MHALDLDRTPGVAHYATSLLDELIPLRDASHADVVSYTVETPMRYAKCFGVRQGGSKISLLDNRQFIGWSCHDAKRSLLFRTSEALVEIHVDPYDPSSCNEPGYVRDIIVEPKDRETGAAAEPRKFIGVDGSVLTV